jgi:hypothetical protein
MKETWIIGIHVTDRDSKTPLVQNVLTKFGCSIRTRLGLHEVTENYCAGSGLILLELTGDVNEFPKLESELMKIGGIEVKKMIFGDRVNR